MTVSNLEEQQLAELVRGEIERLARYERAWKSWQGDQPKQLKVGRIDPKTKRRPPDDNVRVNLPRLIVNTGVHYLFGKELAISTDEERAKNPQEEWLDKVLPMDRRMLLLQKLGTNGGVTGHVYARIHLPKTSGALPRVVALDPAIVYPKWKHDDIEIVLSYRIEYRALVDGRIRRFRQMIEPTSGDPESTASWIVRDFEATVDGEWKLTGETAWEYPFPPIADWQNLPNPNEYFGLADLEDDVVELCNAINRVLSNANKMVRIFGHPKTVASGLTKTQLGEIDTTPGGIIGLPHPDAKLTNLDTRADLAGSIELKRDLVSGLHEIAMIPEVATGTLDKTGDLSGAALQILYGPLLALTNAKRLTYGVGLDQLVRRLLVVGRQVSTVEDVDPVLNWPNVVPSDPKTEREVALLDVDLGASKESQLERFGYDPEKEKERRQTEAAEAAERAREAFDSNELDGLDDPARPRPAPFGRRENEKE